MKRIVACVAILASVASVFMINNLFFNPMASAEKINLTASDGQKISAIFYPVPDPRGWLLLTHKMPATKESWDSFAKEMQATGYSSIAIDLRGHGESQGGPDGYMNFTDAEHQAGILDLEAAWEFLKSQGATPDKVTAIGASIGANLSLQFLTMHHDIGGGVLLSTGNYKGIDSGALVKKLDAGQKLLLVASRKDERATGNNAAQNQEYYDSAAQVTTRHLVLFDSAGHGTDLLKLEKEYNLMEAIKKFLTYGSIN